MSSVLHPVGPREPRVYWVRRLAILVVLLIVVLVIAKACSGGGSANAAKKAPKPKVTPTTSTTPTTGTGTGELSACDPSALTLALSTDSTSYTEGQSATLVGTFTNPGSSTCTFSLAPSHETWTIKSGDVTVWSTKGCTTSSLVKGVKIKAGGTKKVTITWDGHQLSSTGCTAGDVATAGEYTVHATLDGVTSTAAAVFHITSAT